MLTTAVACAAAVNKLGKKKEHLKLSLAAKTFYETYQNKRHLVAKARHMNINIAGDEVIPKIYPFQIKGISYPTPGCLFCWDFYVYIDKERTCTNHKV